MQPVFSVENEDAQLLHLLGDAPVRPILIMGLHRSGTTLLYETLARLFPLAPLTAHQIVFYERLLARHQHGRGGEDARSFDEHFASLGIATRQIDSIALSHATPEEYGWLLRRYGSSVRLGDDTAALFAQMCRKLRHLRPDAANVVLKSPWDTGRAADILRLFPGTKFVYIRRHPLRILNSQLNNAVLFSARPAPYLDLLTEGFTFARAVFAAQRAVCRVAGERIFRRLMVPVLIRDVVGELQAYRQGFEALPAAARMETSYREFTERPRETLERIADFLGFAPAAESALPVPSPRRVALEPEIEAARPAFLQRLARLGLSPHEEDEE